MAMYTWFSQKNAWWIFTIVMLPRWPGTKSQEISIESEQAIVSMGYYGPSEVIYRYLCHVGRRESTRREPWIPWSPWRFPWRFHEDFCGEDIDWHIDWSIESSKTPGFREEKFTNMGKIVNETWGIELFKRGKVPSLQLKWSPPPHITTSDLHSGIKLTNCVWHSHVRSHSFISWFTYLWNLVIFQLANCDRHLFEESEPFL